MMPLIVSSGEPAGIGPDICLHLAGLPIPLVVLADKQVLKTRALLLGMDLDLKDYLPGSPVVVKANTLTIAHIPCSAEVNPGKTNPENANYVLSLLTTAVKACLNQEFSALVTAPVHKEVINQAGIPFTGHTEFLAAACDCEKVVMMLACKAMKVALMTTHIPLREVADAITEDLITQGIYTLFNALQRDFGLKAPKIAVAGLNPHAGEGGYLGFEDLRIIKPAIEKLKQLAIDVQGPFPADTLFSPMHLEKYDVFVTMYHDQGLPVLKYAGFGEAYNVSLGLPIIRTSVDHGTALSLAGSGKAVATSLLAAVEMAHNMVNLRRNHV